MADEHPAKRANTWVRFYDSICLEQRLRLEGHPDQPEWLSHVNAAVLKVKLATAIIGISSIHLLATFIKVGELTSRVILWQLLLHLTFVVSAVAIALIDRIMSPPLAPGGHA